MNFDGGELVIIATVEGTNRMIPDRGSDAFVVRGEFTCYWETV